MSILINCPTCNRRIKVKQEWLGRKVKCYRCKTGILAAAEVREETTSSSVDVSQRRRWAEKDAARRKKYNPPKRSSAPLMYVSIAGLVVVGAVALVIALGGDRGRDVGEVGGKPEPTTTERIVNGPRAEGSSRSVPVKQVQDELKQIGTAIFSWYDDEKRGPTDIGELSKYYENNARLNAILESKRISVVWGVSRSAFQGNSSQVMAYETEPDHNGIRIVLRADGEIGEMNDIEFAAFQKQRAN